MKIRTELFHIRTAPLGGCSPLPHFRARKTRIMPTTESFPKELATAIGNQVKTLPYLMQDRYTHNLEQKALKSFVLENEYLKARFLPEYGGRLHSLFDKENGRELLFANPVIKPGNLANRNAWLSGGIEWNVGNFGHCYTTCDNVYTAILQDGEGNDFLRIYEFERNKSIFWQIDFHLPEGSRHLYSHVRLVNPFDRDTTVYWWTNIAVPIDPNTRVLASNKNIISFVDKVCNYESLPYIDAMPGVDATYPKNASRAFDYFIQKNKDGECTWESAAYDDGLVFYERSTAPLYYKKLFCWGEHGAGRHWQEYLSDGKGTGYYAELQAGVAPSQLHDMMFPRNSKMEWTQCFGGVKLDKDRLHDKNYDAAVAYFDEKIDERMSADAINQIHEKFCALADLPVTEESLAHLASGFGAVEILRMEKEADGKAPKNLLFPASQIGAEEKIWCELLESGKLSAPDVKALPVSYMTAKPWVRLLRDSVKDPDNRNWFSLYQFATAAYEYGTVEKLSNVAYEDEAECEAQVKTTREALLASIACAPSMWAYRNLAVLEKDAGNAELAEQYYDKAIAMDGAFDDFGIVSEYLRFLNLEKKYAKIWEIYETLPTHCKKVDRIRITVAGAAVMLDKLDYLDTFFAEKHYAIAEGETSLSNVWFDYCAKKLMKERGIESVSDEEWEALLDEVWEKYPPAYDIDFRMSLDRKNKYRVAN